MRQATWQNGTCPSVAIVIDGISLCASSPELLRPGLMLAIGMLIDDNLLGQPYNGGSHGVSRFTNTEPRHP